MQKGQKNPAEVNLGRYKDLPTALKFVFILLTVCGLSIAVLFIFSIPISGESINPIFFYYIIIACYSTTVFLIMPARAKDKKVQWFDLIAAGLTFGLSVYFAFNFWEIGNVGWVPSTPVHAVMAFIFCLLILEGGRRGAGTIYLIVCIIFGIYPLFSDYMPGVLFGFGLSFSDTFSSHVFTEVGMIGLPSKIIGEILLGFLLFAGFLTASGAGQFFFDLAQSIFGRFRGGPAKVAVVASGLFGSLSGSSMSNVVATGSVTIPAMKRMGFPPHYAGAIEACASTGGTFMPPVMGAVAFVMCAFLSIEYSVVLKAAIVPSLLYYLGLLMQVDSYAAKSGLKGDSNENVQSFWNVLKNGWVFLVVLIFLVWGFVWMRWEYKTPYYATLLMIILSFTSRERILTPHRIIKAIASVGQIIVQSIAVILPIGFIMGGLIITGTSGSFTAGLVNIAGGNLFLIIFIGIVACYILGMAGMLVSAYIFLAVTLAPALIEVGNLNTLSVHLFICYYAMLSALTPPVAVVAFLGASLAKASPMKTAMVSMRLGFVKYFIPLFFLFNPELIFQGSVKSGLYHFGWAIVGVIIMAGGLDRYLIGIGRLNIFSSIFFIIGGFLICYPNLKVTILGIVISLVGIIIGILKNKLKFKAELTSKA